MPKFAYQASERLAASLAAICDAEKMKRLMDRPDSLSAESSQYASLLCNTLLDYSSYRHPDDPEVDPFDDPFVGAALLTSKGTLLGSHRKVERNEPHAEPTAILEALSNVQSDEARALVRAIEDAYVEKIWLRSEGDASSFASLFATAGSIVRSALDPDENLILISTLEPCRDFESQPSCSRIISEFKPTVVLYGCDDTNAKGQGRSILLENGLQVIPNLAIVANLAVNRLFYSSIHYLQRVHRAARNMPNGLNPFYVTVNLNRPPFQTQIQDGRLHLSVDELDDVPVYLGAVEARAPSIKIPSLSASDVDKSCALFTNHFSPMFVSTYFSRYLKNTGRIPGIIVSSQSIGDDPATGALIHNLRGAGIRIYPDVLRKGDEQFLAVESIDRAIELNDTPDFLYVTVKHRDGYSSFYGDRINVTSDLLGQTDTRRIVIYFDRHARYPFTRMLTALKAARAFDAPHPLSKTSFNVVVVTDSSEVDIIERRDLAEFLRKENLGARFDVRGAVRDSPNQLSPQGVRAEVVGGRLDPLAIEPIQLKSLVDSPTWKGRQTAGWLLDAAVRRDPAAFDFLIVRDLPSKLDVLDWRRTCSLLNAIKRHGRPDESQSPQLLAKLHQFGESLSGSVRRSDSPVLLDIAWRFTAACFAVVRDSEELNRVLWHRHLMEYIGRDPFLLKELMLCTSTNHSVADVAIKQCFDLLHTYSSSLTNAARLHVALRITRHAISWPLNGNAKSLLLAYLASNPELEPACLAEESRCRLILDGGVAPVFREQETTERGRLFASYLFLRTSGFVGREPGLVEAIQREIAQTMGATPRRGEELFSWRGDKTPLARLILSEVPTSQVWSYIKGLADDEDETIRWTALVLAFDSTLRLRGLTPGSRASMATIRLATAEVVNHVFASVPHYWLQREFVGLFCNEHSAENSLPFEARLHTADVSEARTVLAADKTIQWHPEVFEKQAKYRESFRRIALVLPPLTMGDSTPLVSSSTPPLGLGSLGTRLLCEGHDVHLFDCHRYPELASDIANRVKHFDFVAFSVLASTLSTTERLSSIIRSNLGPDAPVVILGGQGVTLQTSDFLENETLHWDYLVIGDGEAPLAAIVRDHRQDTMVHGHGIIPRADRSPQSSKLLSASEWNELPWINRRLFRDGQGVIYEPASTRSGNHRETHVIMSRGCDWGCTFCTEAILRGAEGEVRRSVDDVLAEVSFLVQTEKATRVQFVDDNFLPRILADSSKGKFVGEYADALLCGLATIRRNDPRFGWRAIFRFEDFIAYESLLPDFMGRLKESGCLLLAFGVEHGLEETRRRLKGGTVANEAIRRVVQSLSTAGIAAKGYFMIGGPGESQESSDATIQFAIDAGFGLAYFAIYKHFRKLVQLSRQKSSSQQDRRKKMIFGLLTADLEERVLECRSTANWMSAFGEAITEERLQEARDTVEKLRARGFKFTELFKYNDFHDTSDNTALGQWDSNSMELTELLAVVRRAYARFYLRAPFVDVYRKLTDNGY